MSRSRQENNLVMPRYAIRAFYEAGRYIDAMYPVFFLGKHVEGVKNFFASIPTPFNGAVLYGAAAVNDLVNMLFTESLGKRDPLSFLRAQGGGNAGKGFAKNATATLAAFTVVAGAGILLEMLRGQALESLSQSENDYAPALSYVLSEQALTEFSFSTIGYIGYRVVKHGVLKAWDACMPSVPEEPNAEPHLAQTFLQYGMSGVASFVGQQAILYHSSYFDRQDLADHARFNELALLAAYAALFSAKYLGIEDNFKKEPPRVLAIGDLEHGGVVEAPEFKPWQHLTTRVAINAIFVIGVAYALSEIICAYDPRNICSENNLAHRTERAAETLGVTLMALWACEKLLPQILPPISLKQVGRNAIGFFNRTHAGEREPLIDSKEKSYGTNVNHLSDHTSDNDTYDVIPANEIQPPRLQ